ncbi:MAG TPA: GtrA family protein [Anaerolineaceae bacterium]|jgi:putative flippase GtrA|nr:GtrA family protein [Anaerolineaceae bacterium]
MRFNPKERDRFLRFAVVGMIGAVVDFGLFNLLSAVFHISTVVSSVISFTAAVISNFVWNRFWTYPDSRSKQVTQQVIQFIVISVVGLGIRTPLFAWLESTLVGSFSRLNFRLPVTPTFLGHNIALAVAVVVVMFWNFFANRYWTYSDVK